MRTAVVLDADETLIDLRPAVTGALACVLEEMRRRTPAAAGVSLADLAADWGGNSRAERRGLAGQFTFALYAHENGLP
jgi:hypothetical protein